MADRSTASEETIGTLTAGTPALNDLIHFYRNNADFKATMQQFAKFVLEDYAGSTLAGGARSAKSAIDLLNSSLIVPNNRIAIPNGSDFNTYTTPGVYAVASDTSASTMTNIPRNSSGKLIVITRGNNLNYLQQKYIPTTTIYIEYVRNYNNSTWTEWEQLPTRAEIDSLNSRTTRKIISTYTKSSDISNAEVTLSQIGNLIIGYVIFRTNVTMEITGYVIVSDLPTSANTQFIGVCVSGNDAGKTTRFAYRGNSIQTYYTNIPPKAGDTWLLQVIGFLA